MPLIYGAIEKHAVLQGIFIIFQGFLQKISEHLRVIVSVD